MKLAKLSTDLRAEIEDDKKGCKSPSDAALPLYVGLLTIVEDYSTQLSYTTPHLPHPPVNTDFLPT